MAVDHGAFAHDSHIVGMHGRVLGGKARDKVCADGDLRARTAQPLCERDRLRAAVAALHPLQDHVAARLQREVHMRHDPRLASDQFE